MRGHWKTIALAAAVAVIALSAVGAAYGDSGAKAPPSAAQAGACAALAGDSQAFDAVQDLRTQHRQEMRDWFEEFGLERGGTEAQSALRQLRAEHRSEMRELFETLGVDVPTDARPDCGQRGAGGCGGWGAGPDQAPCGGGGAGCAGAGSGQGGGCAMGGWN